MKFLLAALTVLRIQFQVMNMQVQTFRDIWGIPYKLLTVVIDMHGNIDLDLIGGYFVSKWEVVHLCMDISKHQIIPQRNSRVN